MEFNQITPELLSCLSKEALKGYVIDYSNLSIDENEMIRLISIDVLDKFSKLEDDLIPTLLSSVVCLIVENFVLNLKLIKLSYENNKQV